MPAGLVFIQNMDTFRANVRIYFKHFHSSDICCTTPLRFAQEIFTSANSTIETLGKGLKYVQSQQ